MFNSLSPLSFFNRTNCLAGLNGCQSVCERLNSSSKSNLLSSGVFKTDHYSNPFILRECKKYIIYVIYRRFVHKNIGAVLF